MRKIAIIISLLGITGLASAQETPVVTPQESPVVKAQSAVQDSSDVIEFEQRAPKIQEPQPTKEKSKKSSFKIPQWIKGIKLSGYAIVEYKGQNQKYAKSNSFNLRYLRLALEGRIAKHFFWKVQMQANGQTSTLGKSPRLVDLYGEWQKYEFLRIKVGQFKRPFTFENPINPIDQGFYNYSQGIRFLAGMSDRTGEHPSNGRDIGIQLQGDFLKNSNGRNLLHYQVGIFNGEGINTTDGDNKKDIIGGLWVMPVEGLRIGVFGWIGSRNIVYTDTTPHEVTTDDGTVVIVDEITSNTVNAKKRRYAISAEYVKNDWTFRSEYVHSQGWGQDLSMGDKADAFYALCIAPIIKNKLHVKARYDLYRPSKSWNKSITYYEIGADYMFNKYLQINLEYARVNNRSLIEGHYNMIDVQLSFRF